MHCKIISGEQSIIVACSVCLKVKNNNNWEKVNHTIPDVLNWRLFKDQTDLYDDLRLMVHTVHFANLLVSHGMCPICFDEQMQEIKNMEKKYVRS